MELTIYWTDFSKNELKNIFYFYKKEATQIVAKTIVLGIVNEVKKLKKYPKIGQQEELLASDKRDFRYLVYRNYKIIYWINFADNRIEIFDVFDTRRNPIKILNRK
jgi:plasmid stabilization system protein ParE